VQSYRETVEDLIDLRCRLQERIERHLLLDGDQVFEKVVARVGQTAIGGE